MALLFFPNRVLNPALVLVEVGHQPGCFLFEPTRLAPRLAAVPPAASGRVPGVVVGSLLLSSSASHSTLKLGDLPGATAAHRRADGGLALAAAVDGLAGTSLGAGVGALYAATTISGPPLALFLNNQGLAKEDFRAAMSLFRIVESMTTAVCYLALGLFSAESLRTSGIDGAQVSWWAWCSGRSS